jgi:very-short-patch-repair endonuclease
MARHARMTAAGISVLHFSPAQIRGDGDKVIAQIRDALQHGRPAEGITTVPAAA